MNIHIYIRLPIVYNLGGFGDNFHKNKRNILNVTSNVILIFNVTSV